MSFPDLKFCDSVFVREGDPPWVLAPVEPWRRLNRGFYPIIASTGINPVVSLPSIHGILPKIQSR
jgi:hypothetical protein